MTLYYQDVRYNSEKPKHVGAPLMSILKFLEQSNCASVG